MSEVPLYPSKPADLKFQEGAWKKRFAWGLGIRDYRSGIRGLEFGVPGKVAALENKKTGGCALFRAFLRAVNPFLHYTGIISPRNV